MRFCYNYIINYLSFFHIFLDFVAQNSNWACDRWRVYSRAKSSLLLICLSFCFSCFFMFVIYMFTCLVVFFFALIINECIIVRLRFKAFAKWVTSWLVGWPLGWWLNVHIFLLCVCVCLRLVVASVANELDDNHSRFSFQHDFFKASATLNSP